MKRIARISRAASFDEMASKVGEGICPNDGERLVPTEIVGQAPLGVCGRCGLGWRLRRAEIGEEWLATEDVPLLVDTVYIFEVRDTTREREPR